MCNLVTKEAPDFTAQAVMPDNTIAELKLSSYRGKHVCLFFYPLDFTFVCPSEIIAFDKQLAAFKEKGCEVIGVSVDSQFTHLAWKDAEKLLANVQYPMGADPTGAVSRMFGVYDCGSGLALRGTFLINPAGVLAASEVNFYNVGRNADELLRKMEANAYLLTHPAEACPARWKQGAKTLKPSEKMVGKVYEALQ